MQPSRKRSRTAMGSSAAQRGMWAQMKFSKAQPWADWGAMRVQRGTPDNIALFGETYKSASEQQRAARKAHGYTGRGMYTGRGRYYGKALGGLAGRLLGSKFGVGDELEKIGGLAGDKLTDLIHGRGLYTGRGEYEKTNTNELMASSSLSSPQFLSVPDESGSLIVKHREYIGDIFAPAAATVSDFTVQAFPINPGLEQTFPWLSQIAQNYEEYELVQCVFEFVSTVQDINSSNGQVGTIISATQYNPSEADFTDKPAMAAYAHSVSGKSTDNQTHGVECDPKKLSGSEGKYIRANPVLVGEDLKTYDHGRFQLATHNIPSAMASGTLGELYVNYCIKLRKPKFFTGRGLGLTRSLFVGDLTQGSGATQNFMLGTDAGALVGRQNNLAVKVVRTSQLVRCTFPAYYGGRISVTIRVEGNNFVWNSHPVYTLEGNVSFVNDQYAGGDVNTDSPSYISGRVHDLGMFQQLSLNIEPATNATDNVLQIAITGLAGSGSGLVINQSSLEFSEYNSFGTAGAAQLVNAAGTPVVL